MAIFLLANGSVNDDFYVAGEDPAAEPTAQIEVVSLVACLTGYVWFKGFTGPQSINLGQLPRQAWPAHPDTGAPLTETGESLLFGETRTSVPIVYTSLTHSTGFWRHDGTAMTTGGYVGHMWYGDPDDPDNYEVGGWLTLGSTGSLHFVIDSLSSIFPERVTIGKIELEHTFDGERPSVDICWNTAPAGWMSLT